MIAKGFCAGLADPLADVIAQPQTLQVSALSAPATSSSSLCPALHCVAVANLD